MNLKGIVFDFDGVLVETEEAEFLAWRQIWSEFGQQLSLVDWAPCIGTHQAASTFDPVGGLVARTGLALSEGELRARCGVIAQGLLLVTEPMVGVVEWLDAADACGFGVAIASSSSRSWISGHLERLGLAERFPVIACFDDCGVTKPDPASYRHACEALGITPAEALAVEDSHNGLLAAKAAGLACVVVPTLMTAEMDFAEADLILSSLSLATPAEVAQLLAQTDLRAGRGHLRQESGRAERVDRPIQA